jgi:hypothetical protein
LSGHWLFHDVISDTQLKHVTQSVDERSHHFSLKNCFSNTQVAFCFICQVFSNFESILDVATVKKWFEDIGRIDKRLQTHMFTAMFCLRQIVTRDVFSEPSIDLMSAVLMKFDYMFTTKEAQTTARCLLLKATRLMQASAESDDRTTSSILLILSYVYLHKVSRIADCDSDVTLCLVNIHFAVLYFITGRHHAAVRRCKRAIHSSTQLFESFCYSNLNNTTDNVLGLVALYQYIREKASRQPSVQSHVSNTFTIQLFAYYLLIVNQSASINCTDKLFRVLMKQYKLCLLNQLNALISDFLLFYVLRKQWSLTDKDKSIRRSLFLKFTATELRRLLHLLSVKQLTEFLQTVSREYKSVRRIATNDIEALYAYQCGQYEQCLQMSQHNVSTLWYQMQYFDIPISGCMSQMMTDGVDSMQTIIHLLNSVGVRPTVINQLTLSLCLVIEAKLKLDHPMTSQVEELHRVKELHSRIPIERVCDCVLLSFVYRKIVVMLTRKFN